MNWNLHNLPRFSVRMKQETNSEEICARKTADSDFNSIIVLVLGSSFHKTLVVYTLQQFTIRRDFLY